MDSEKTRRTEIDAVFRQVRRKIVEVQRMLDPDVDGELSVEELQARLLAKLESLPEAERENLKLKVAVAVADLGGLIGTMSEQVDVIKTDLRKLNGQSAAAAAYGRWGGRTGAPRNGGRS